jgi:hypothetical protein
MQASASAAEKTEHQKNHGIMDGIKRRIRLKKKTGENNQHLNNRYSVLDLGEFIIDLILGTIRKI